MNIVAAAGGDNTINGGNPYHAFSSNSWGTVLTWLRVCVCGNVFFQKSQWCCHELWGIFLISRNKRLWRLRKKKKLCSITKKKVKHIMYIFYYEGIWYLTVRCTLTCPKVPFVTSLYKKKENTFYSFILFDPFFCLPLIKGNITQTHKPKTTLFLCSSLKFQLEPKNHGNQSAWIHSKRTAQLWHSNLSES